MLVAAKKVVDWEVELASGARVSVDSLIHECLIQVGDMFTTLDLRITPLGSYDVVLGMDWLSAHSAKVDCRQKKIKYIDDHGSPRVILRV